MRSILHCIPDSLYSDIAIEQFEAVAPGMSRFVIVHNESTFRHITNPIVERISSDELKQVLADDSYKAIVFHRMTYSYRKLLKTIPASKTVAWIGWGFDYYDSLLKEEHSDGLFLERTKAYSISRRDLLDGTAKPKRRLKDWFSRTGLYQSYLNRMLRRIDLFSPVLDVEYDLIKKHNSWFRAQYQEWNYGDLSTLIPLDLGNANGGDVLLGNSATLANNHFDAIDLINIHVDLLDGKVLCPISYGDPTYRDAVLAFGMQALPGRFEPLITIFTAGEYHRLISNCGYVFMFHLRQQGLGNIISRMFSGGKVYLLKDNPVFHWFKSRGAAVFSIEELVAESLSTGEKVKLQPLSKDEIQTNQEVIKSQWGVDVQRSKTFDFVQKLLK